MKVRSTRSSGVFGTKSKNTKQSASKEKFSIPPLPSNANVASLDMAEEVSKIEDVNPLIVLQDIANMDYNTAYNKRKKQYKHANSMLELLETVQLDYINNNHSQENIVKLKEMLQITDSFVIDDSKLRGIIEEIKVRITVELTKMEKKHADHPDRT